MVMTMAMISPHRRPIQPPDQLSGEEQRVAAAPRHRLEKRLLFRCFLDGRINRGPSRAPGGVGPTQEGRWRGQELGRARHPPGCPLAALWPPFGPPKASGTLIFYIFFWDFSSVPKYPETCTKENNTGSSAENSVSPG